MSQVTLGYANVTSGSSAVTSDTNANWSGVVAGAIFTIANSGVFYAVAAAPTFSGGVWHLTLTSNYGSTTATNQNYVISTSFSPLLGLPYPENGDTQQAAINKRAMLLLDAYCSPGSLAITDATTVTLDARTLPEWKVATWTLGGNRTLTITNAVDGQYLSFRFTQDATGSRTITITNGRGTTTIPAVTLASAAGKITYLDLCYHSASGKFDYVRLTS